MGDFFDFPVYLYNRKKVQIDDKEVNLLSSRYKARVIYCGDEKDLEIINKLNGHEYFIIFSDGGAPIGFTCLNTQYAISETVKTILNNMEK